MASDENPISGTERAAILLMSLGEEEASQVLKHMKPKEVQAVGVAMAGLKNVTREAADEVLSTFVTTVDDAASFGVGTEDYIRKVLTNAFGANKADAFIDRILVDGDASGFDTLQWMSAESIAELVRDEHPQIIAIVLSYLEAEQAAEVLANFEDALRAEVVMRVARLDDVQQSALAEIESLIAAKSSNITVSRTAKVGGDRVAAGIVNALNNADGEAVLEQINLANPDLGNRIAEMMFVFDSLLNVDDRGIQTLLREVSNDRLVIALKGADPAVQKKIFQNMSKRAAALLEEDMEARGPMKLSDVEAAQKEILEVARRLADNGDINLGDSDDEYV
ncbi:MAG: flagellar motor switch protein FliG [Pseudomonadota bacterium]